MLRAHAKLNDKRNLPPSESRTVFVSHLDDGKGRRQYQEDVDVVDNATALKKRWNDATSERNEGGVE